MLNTFRKKHPNLYSILIGVSIVMFWRGVWGVLDLYFFPGNEIFSYLFGIGFGLTVLWLNDFRLHELE